MSVSYTFSQYPGTSTAHPVLARDRVENSLTYGYFEMIGTLSKHQEGVKCGSFLQVNRLTLLKTF